MKKKIIIIGSVVFALLLTGIFWAVRDLSHMRQVEPQGINLSSIPDGGHTGTFEYGRFANILTVQVAGNRITEIDIEDDVFAAFITNISGDVFRRVIEAQDTRIDAVAGATATTMAYLKAIENALAGVE